MISDMHTTNRQSFKKVTCPFKAQELSSLIGSSCYFTRNSAINQRDCNKLKNLLKMEMSVQQLNPRYHRTSQTQSMQLEAPRMSLMQVKTSGALQQSLKAAEKKHIFNNIKLQVSNQIKLKANQIKSNQCQLKSNFALHNCSIETIPCYQFGLIRETIILCVQIAHKGKFLKTF